MEPVLIVGAGIVGLTLGQALQKVMECAFRDVISRLNAK